VLLLIYVIKSSSNRGGKEGKQDYYQMVEMSTPELEVDLVNDNPVIPDEVENDASHVVGIMEDES
jgi:hypothetical protein